MTRVYKLNNGDVFNVCGVLIEYDEGVFYEVEDLKPYSYFVFDKKYERTGKIYTIEEINEIVRNHDEKLD